MKKELQEIDVGKDRFVVDVSLSELRLKSDPLTTLSFFDMNPKPGGYEFDYNTHTKLMATEFSDSKDIIKVTIPAMVSLDPEGVAIKYGMDVSSLPDKDSLLKQDKALWSERLSGMLPAIRIGEEDYLIDIKGMNLLSLSRDYVIPLSELTLNERGDKYLGFYDPVKKEALPLQTQVDDLPKQAQLLIVPGEGWLDPLGTVEKYDLYREQYMNKHPVQEKQEGRLYKLSETAIKKAVKEDHRQQYSKPALKHRKRKKGKHI